MTAQTPAKPVHTPQDAFAVVGNELTVGGSPVTDLARKAGGRPFYAYDRELMTRKVARLRRELPERINLHYAIKANPMPAVVDHMATLTGGLDVASAAELAVALASGTPPADISFAGPGKSAADLEAAVSAGVLLVIESETEAGRIARLAIERGVRAPVALRVNPDFQLKASGMKMGGGAQPFGIDAELIPALIDRLDHEALDLRGFHIFSGSQNLREESIIDAQAKTLELAARLAKALPGRLHWLNIGGGLGVPYFPGDRPLDTTPIMDALGARLDEYGELLRETEVVMELGRYLVAEAGVYVCAVSDRKVSRGCTYLVTNGGLHHHLAVTGNFGQVIRKNYPVCLANRVESDLSETVTVVGPLCTPLDLLANQMDLPRAEIGDLIAVFMSGAYGYTASPHLFLSHPPPKEFCL